jgi:hypothetical protein
MTEPWHSVPEVLTGDGPRTHALVIGVSRYRHLPDADGNPPDEPAGGETFELVRLECAANGALAVAEWLRDSYRQPDAPLASVRLLLSPSELELEDPRMAAADGATPPATRAATAEAIDEWRRACRGDPGGVAILYLAGHGVMISSEGDVVVLLEEFAAREGQELDAAVDLQGVRNGMRGPELPKRQFYFADACAFAPELRPGQELKGGVTLSAGTVPGPGVSPVYSAAAPARQAWGVPGETTFFAQALLESVDLLAVAADGDGGWVVTDNTLIPALGGRVFELSGERSFQAGGQLAGDAVFHRPSRAPRVAVEITIAPDAAHPVAVTTLKDGDGEPYRSYPPMALITDAVPAGYYTVAVEIDPATDGLRARNGISCPAMPPRAKPVLVDVTTR